MFSRQSGFHYFKFIFFTLFSFLFLSSCSSTDKEILKVQKQILEIEKKRFMIEKAKLQHCGCCSEDKSSGSCCPEILLILEKEEIEKVEDEKSPCKRIQLNEQIDIWKLAAKGDWSYSPSSLKSQEICEDEKKEYFYKQYSNSESYVASTQVPKTKQSSCINNVLFHGKSKLYQSMINSAPGSGKLDSEKDILSSIVNYNNAEKGRSFYYECKPTDPSKNWDKCTCVLYASYKDGKEGIQSLQ